MHQYTFTLSLIVIMLSACNTSDKDLNIEVFETSASGNQLQKLTEFPTVEEGTASIKLSPDKTFQTITGFGGSFTESSASLLYQLGKEIRN